MRKPKLPPGSPDDTEHAFYEALQHADIDRLMACWADEEDIVCVHPGGQRLVGHTAVRAAFEALLANGGVRVQPERHVADARGQQHLLLGGRHAHRDVDLAPHHVLQPVSAAPEPPLPPPPQAASCSSAA